MSSFYTQDGMVRVRYWPLVAFGAFAALCVLLNVFTFLAIATGSELLCNADPFWHAPLFWLESLS